MLESILPKDVLVILRSVKRLGTRALRRGTESVGYVITRKADYYSPLPSEFELGKSVARWNKPSSLVGLEYDIDGMKDCLLELMSQFLDEFMDLPPYSELGTRGYGPGYPHVDAFVLYAMIRRLKPSRYLEVGSGLSTYYCSLAARRNAEEGHRTEITCIEPFPYEALYQIDGIEIIQSVVQDVALERFQVLGVGDVLFIDSSHIVRIDGDVPFLFLEVLPRLATGVHIHVHDIPFPYNVPYPADYWVLTNGERRPKDASNWPFYWNEAMILQAFLAYNQHFEIALSLPIIRHFDEDYLLRTVPITESVADQPNTYSSVWLHRVRP